MNKNNEVKNGLVIEKTGQKSWYQDGEFHREDGPAVELADGSTYWYKNGKFHRDGDEPAIEKAEGRKYWYKNGKRHRRTGPAFVYGRTEHWYLNGKQHRINGPAVENADGTKEWWIKGEQLSEQEFNAIRLNKKLSEKLSINEVKSKKLKI